MITKEQMQQAVYAAIYGDGPPLSSAPEIGEQRATSHDEATILSELYGILGVDSLAGAVGAARAGVDNEATLAELISTSTAERDEALARLESLRAELDALRRDRAMLCEAIAPGTFVGSVAAHTQRARQLRESLRHNLRSDFPKPGLVQRLADGDQELEEDVPL